MSRSVRREFFSKALRVALVAVLSVYGIVPAAFAEEENATASSGSPQITNGYVEGEMLVVFADGVSPQQAMESISTLSCSDEGATEAEGAFDGLEESGDGSAVVVQLEEGASVEEAVEEAMDNPAILYAQPNYVYRLIDDYQGATEESASNYEQADYSASFMPNDPVLDELNPNTDKNAWYLDQINAFDAWENTRCDASVTVAILDTGCRMDHEDLVNNLWVEYAYNAYSNRPLTQDYAGHGTHVAGLVAAEANNNLGIAGTSYNAKILPICVFDNTGQYCYTSTLIQAYDYLLDLDANNPEMNIHVVNMSLGGYGSMSSDDYLLEDRIAEAESRDIATVVAGGNGDDYGNPITDPSYPSDYDECIAVTALSTDGITPTTWCDYNEYKDICAPGLYIYSTLRDNVDTYGMMSGTSMASPIVAGSLALLWAAVPELTVEEAKTAIYSTAEPIQVSAGREGKYGHGQLNIAAALESIKGVFIKKVEQPVYSGQTYQMAANVPHVETTEGVAWSVESGTGTAEIDAETGMLHGLMPGTVTVTATVGDYTDKKTVTIEPLAAVEGLSAANHVDGLELAWAPNALAEGYAVMRAASDSDDFAQIAVVDNVQKDTISYVDTNVVSGEMYSYQVVPFSDVAQKGTGVASATAYGLRLAGVVNLEENSASAATARVLSLGLSYDQTMAEPVNAVVLVAAKSNDYQQIAASVAGVEHALIVPVDAEGVTSEMQDLIEKLQPNRVIALGGEQLVSDDCINVAAQAAGTEDVVRFAGDDIAAVSLDVYNKYKRQWGTDAFVCAPGDTQNALAVASYAYAAKAPVLFSEQGGERMTTKSLLALEKFSKIMVVGSESVIAKGAYNQIARVATGVSRFDESDVNAQATRSALESGLLRSAVIGYAQPYDAAGWLANVGLLGLMGGPVIAKPAGSAALDPDVLGGESAACAIVSGDTTATDAGGNSGDITDPSAPDANAGAEWTPATGHITVPPEGVTPPEGTVYGAWTQYNGHRAFRLPDGTIATGWTKVDSKWYCMDSDGALRTGWYEYQDDWYYLSASGVMSSDEWVLVDGSYYYFYESGVMATETWVGPYYVDADGKRSSETKTYTIAVSAKDTQGRAVAGATLVGGGEGVVGGTTHTVVAPAVSGYVFKGWYGAADTSLRKVLGTTLSYSFAVEGNANLVAVYEPNASVSVTFNCSNNVYKVNGSTKSTKTTMSYKIGETVTVEVVDTTNFLYWRNAAGMKVSANPVYTFAASFDDTLVPEYVRPLAGSAVVIWESSYGQILRRSQLTADSDVVEPAVPARLGYDVTGWDKDADQIKALIAEGQTMITVRPVETLSSVRYSVKVSGGVLADGTKASTFAADEIVEATAAQPAEGMKFSCWKDGDEIVSFNQTCRFYASKDMSLTAVYVKLGETVATGVSAQIASISYDADAKRLTFVSLLSASEGVTMLHAGIVATNNAAKASDLCAATADYVRGSNPGDNSTFRFTWNKSEVNEGDTWFVRPYVVYADSTGTHEVYGTVQSWPQQ